MVDLEAQLKISSPKWHELLREEFNKPYFSELNTFVKNKYQAEKCYPPKGQIFEAFNRCSPEEVKVVILGQDPYHGEGQANGLAFSVHPGVKMPPSLKNIVKEVINDCGSTDLFTGDLSGWAQQGVLLLNTVLTVSQSSPASHRKIGWEMFTDSVLTKINTFKQPVVFLLWGNDAARKEALLNNEKHKVLKAKHPSPLSANRGGWFHQHHFSRANDFLKQHGIKPVNW